VISREEFDQDPSMYGLERDDGKIINPIRTWDCFPRFANDMTYSDPFGDNNCYLYYQREILERCFVNSEEVVRRYG